MLSAALCLLGSVSVPFRPAWAQSVHFFRIGAGPPGGTLFQAAGWISAAISNPPGSRPCNQYGSCGVPGLIALAQTTEGGYSNIEALRNHSLDAGIAYADMAHDALTGKGAFAVVGPFAELCAVTALSPESLHILVRRHARIRTVADLRGKRIAIGEASSGSAALSSLVLRQYGLGRHDYTPLNIQTEAAAEALVSARIDAVMFLAHPPSSIVSQLVGEHGCKLLPLDRTIMDKVIAADPFLAAQDIPPTAYGTGDPVSSLSAVPVLLIRRDMDASLVSALARALWVAMRDDKGHPLDAAAFAASQIKRRGVPLHPAAQAFRDTLVREEEAKSVPHPPR